MTQYSNRTHPSGDSLIGQYFLGESKKLKVGEIK